MADSEQNLKEMWGKLDKRFKLKTGRDLKPKSTKNFGGDQKEIGVTGITNST
jgi:hypothetical protein